MTQRTDPIESSLE